MSLPCMRGEHAQNRLRPCSPSIKLKRGRQKGGPCLSQQSIVQVARGSRAHEAGRQESSRDLRNLWEITTASGDLCSVVYLIRIRMS